VTGLVVSEAPSWLSCGGSGAHQRFGSWRPIRKIESPSRADPGVGEYTRAGTLSDAERAWDRQLADAGHTALAWRILGRDANGHLVAATTLGCGHHVDVERYCTAFQ